jgi:hypothetical protein
MFLSCDQETIDKVEQLLRVNCPSPEAELAALGGLAACVPKTEEGAELRRAAVDVDDLVAQSRWHLGQALLLMETCPVILEKEEDGDEFEKVMKEIGMPSSALLLLRGFIKDADRALYRDLTEPRQGGTVAGWIFHMMIDSSLYRTFAALDRLAHVLWNVAGLPRQDGRGKEIRVYFRPGKVKEIDTAINNAHTQEIVKIASGPLMEFLTGYRNRYTHKAKAYSKIAGTLPVDEWHAADGTRVEQRSDGWDAELLFALGRAGYLQLVDVLKLTVPVCEEKLGQYKFF